MKFGKERREGIFATSSLSRPVCAVEYSREERLTIPRCGEDLRFNLTVWLPYAGTKRGSTQPKCLFLCAMSSPHPLFSTLLSTAQLQLSKEVLESLMIRRYLYTKNEASPQEVDD